jgi:flavin-dependent dehydrogenase
MRTDTDVLVVGAGLAGLTCARRVAERGHRVVLVDVKTSLEHGIHTTGIFVRRTFEEYALPAGSLGPPVRRVVLHAPSGRRLELESRRDEYRVGRMAQLYRQLLAAAEAAGVRYEGGTRFGCAARSAAGGWKAWLERGGRRWLVRARYLVGADGARSRVARVLGVDENRSWLVGVEEVYAGGGDVGRPVFHCLIDPRHAPGYLGWVVADGEHVHVGVAGSGAAYTPHASLSWVRERARTLVPLPAAAAERRGGLIPVNGVLRRIAAADGLVVGDAAGAVSPLTAGGLDGGVRLSERAADVLSRALEGGAADALAAYDGATYRARFASRLLMRRALDAVMHPLVAEAGLALLSVPPFRSLARHVFFGRSSFPDVPARSAARSVQAVARHA